MDRPLDAVADALARLCAHPDRYRRCLDKVDQHFVDDLIRTSGTVGDLEAALERLDRALLVAGHRPGLFNLDARGLEPVPIGSIGPYRSETLFLCPGRRCTRVFLPADNPDELVPVCVVFGMPLRERRL